MPSNTRQYMLCLIETKVELFLLQSLPLVDFVVVFPEASEDEGRPVEAEPDGGVWD